MKVCRYCQNELPDDAVYCSHCGKALLKKETIKEEKLKKNNNLNNWGKLALIIFFIALIGLDFIGATFLNALKIDSKFIFYISLVLYIGVIIMAVYSLVVDHRAKKTGYETSGNEKFAYVAIVMSFYIALVNLSQVILK